MTHKQSILSHLNKHSGLCDDCLAIQLSIHPRQTVNRLCRELLCQIQRAHGPCSTCSELKIINNPTCGSQNFVPVMPKPSAPKSRNLDLKTSLNEALISVFSLEKRDYFQDLSFTQLLKLKQGLARIHDTVTLKLTMELVSWIASRFNLSTEHQQALSQQVDSQSANASGFDLYWEQPQIIAEVKGCIPMNGGNVFGSAQFKSLTNDLRQMLGLPSHGKTKEQLSVRSKVHRTANLSAIKLLALYDCPEVRKAALQWQRCIANKDWFKELNPAIQLQDAPANGALVDPNVVYLVFLRPSASSRQPPLSI